MAVGFVLASPSVMGTLTVMLATVLGYLAIPSTMFARAPKNGPVKSEQEASDDRDSNTIQLEWSSLIRALF